MSDTPTIDTIDDMNEIIAIFDGWEFRAGDPKHKCPYCIGGDEPCTPAVDRFVKEGRTLFHFELKYHTSWDWLMPVIERVETVEMNDGTLYRTAADVKIFYRACIIEYLPDEESGDLCENETTIQTQGETKLEAAYKAIYQFIAWLNNQNHHQ